MVAIRTARVAIALSDTVRVDEHRTRFALTFRVLRGERVIDTFFARDCAEHAANALRTHCASVFPHRVCGSRIAFI